MFVADGEMDIGLVVACCIECGLNQMFFHRCASAVGIGVEQKQSFGQLAIIQSLFLQQIGNDIFIFLLLEQGTYTLAIILLALVAQGFTESKVGNVVKELVFKLSGRSVIFGSKESEKILKHAAGCTGCGHKFNYTMSVSLIFVPRFNGMLAFYLVKGKNAFFDRGCGF